MYKFEGDMGLVEYTKGCLIDNLETVLTLHGSMRLTAF